MAINSLNPNVPGLDVSSPNPAGDRYLADRGYSLPGDGIFGPGIGTSYILGYAPGPAGVLNGQYYYAVSFVTETGETSPWTGTPPKVTFASQQAALTNIPIGPAGVVARRIYRSKVNDAQDRRLYLLAQINDNTTTSYMDNAPDAALGAAPYWFGSNTGRLAPNGNAVLAAGGQAMALSNYGYPNQPGYASIAIGYASQQTGGRQGLRNTSIGVYALQNVSTGYQNTALGTHAGNGITTGAENTLIGYAAGGTAGIVAGNFNTFLGSQAGGSATLTGNGNIGLGRLTLALTSGTVSYNIAIGSYAGKYSDANFKFFLDPINIDRGSLAAQEDEGLLSGLAAATASGQRFRANGITRLGSSSAATVASLPAASAALRGYRGYVTDASAAYTGANIGSTVAGGGANVVPVFCNGVNWVIG